MVPEHDLGAIAPARAPTLRNPAFAGILLQEWDAASGKLVGSAKNDFRRQPARSRRRAASLQAQRLVLFDDRRGRHGLRPRGDHGSLAPHRRALRAAPECPSLDVEGRARRRPAARWPRTNRRNAGRAGLSHASLLAAAEGAQDARRSDARPRSKSASGATTTGSISPRAVRFQPSRSLRPFRARSRASTPIAALRVLTRRPAARLPMAAHALPGQDLLALRSPRLAAAHRARVDRFLVRASAGGAPAGAFRLSRRDGARIRTHGPFSRPPASSPITTAINSTASPSPGTRR